LANGELDKTYGDNTYPVEYAYDAQGRMETLATYKDYQNTQGAADDYNKHVRK